ncbi:MAG: phosphate ABC transporter substrate-binding protein PstS [Elusimicrobia bacterium]|nr:phosphate ABC transporter substrate-binding protein PstS [Elusimicrobiota bacterium]
MKRTLSLIAAVLIAAGPAAAQNVLNGAGATFPYPIYSKWFDEYHKAKPELQINYQSIGSGGGIRQITEKTVDFGATDGPMTNQQMFKVDGKILHVPTVLGAVVPAYNLKGVEELKLSGQVLADIFLGKITRWTDPAIAKLNPEAKLPDAPITVVHRSDGSGTTYCFVDYLSKVSAQWKKKVGANTAVNWPVGLGGKGNEGVAGLVKQTPNALGYIELIYAKQNGIAFASVQNKAGKFVKASVEGVTAAADAAAKSMPKDYRVSITDAPGEETYPISTFTWLLISEKNAEGKGAILRDFLRWMLKEGQGMAGALGYAPLPSSVNAMVAQTLETIK